MFSLLPTALTSLLLLAELHSPVSAAPTTGTTNEARSASPEPIRIPISRRSQDKTVEALIRQAEHIRTRYGGKKNTNSNAEKRASSNSLDMTAYTGSEYYGTVMVGSPASSFSVVLDTGSSDLILATSPCSGCNQNTPLYNPYNSSSAQTSSQSFSIQYGSGSASGTLVEDTVSIAGFSISNKVFAACTTLNNIVDGSISGLLGLGWKALATSGATPLLEEIASNGELDSNLFAFAFKSINQVTSTTAPGGVMTIGAVDTAYYSGEINWISAVQPYSYWLIPLEGISAAGQDLGITADSVVMDSGTTLIAVPTSVAESVYSAIGGQATTLQGQTGYYVYDCSKSVNVTFTFGGVQYPITSENFNAGAANRAGTECYGAIFALESESETNGGSQGTSPQYIIGDAFLTGYYSAFRFSPNPAVGLASLGSGGVAPSNTSSVQTSRSSGAGSLLPASGLTVGIFAALCSLAFI